MSISIDQCEACNHAIFPPRYRCPACGNTTWTHGEAETGEVLAITAVRRRIGQGGETAPTSVAAVRTSMGPIVIARAGDPIVRGDVVSLRYDGDALTVETIPHGPPVE